MPTGELPKHPHQETNFTPTEPVLSERQVQEQKERELYKFKQEAQAFLNGFAGAFSNFPYGNRLRFLVADRSGIDIGSSVVFLNANELLEKGATKNIILWEAINQVSRFSTMMMHPKVMAERKVYERNSGNFEPFLKQFRESMDTVAAYYDVLGKVKLFNAEENKNEIETYLRKIYEEDLTQYPLHEQFLKALLRTSVLEGDVVVSPEVAEMLGKKVRDVEGMPRNFKSYLRLLHKANYTHPQNRYQLLQRDIEPLYKALISKEQLEEVRQGREVKSEMDMDVPPEEQDEYYPQEMETKEQAEGIPSYIFKVNPGLRGYFYEGIKTSFNSQTLRWSKNKQLTEYEGVVVDAPAKISGMVRAGTVALPVPKGVVIDAASFETSGSKVKLLRDQNGGFYVESTELQKFECNIGLADAVGDGNPVDFLDPLFFGKLTQETEAFLEGLQLEGLDDYEIAGRLKDFVHKKTYNVSAQGKLYNGSQSADEYFLNIDNAKQLECYTANTFFVGICRKLGVPARLCVGHYIGNVHESGSSFVTRDTGHAWSEIWNGVQWVLMDATPPMDPAELAQKQQVAKTPDLETDLDKLWEHEQKKAEEEQRKKEERERVRKLQEEMDKKWCAERGIEAKDYKAYVKIEDEMEEYRTDLAKLWQSIIYGKSRGFEYKESGYYASGVTMDMNQVVEHWPDIAGGDFEDTPIMTRLMETEGKIKRPKRIRVRLSSDMSISMSSDPKRMEMVRKLNVLLQSSLRDFNNMLELSRVTTGTELECDVQLWTFDWDGKCIRHFASKVGEEESERQMYKSLRHLETPTGTTNDADVMSQVVDEISSEEEEAIQNGELVDIFIEMTDGSPNSRVATKNELDKLLGKGVVACAFQVGTNSEHDIENFNYVWCDERDESLGFTLGEDVSKVFPALIQVLERYLGNVRV